MFNHGSMGCFVALGYCWCFGFATIASVAFCQDYTSDLNLINTYLDGIEDASWLSNQYIEDIKDNMYHVLDSLSDLNTTETSILYGLDDIKDGLGDIIVYLRSAYSSSNGGYFKVHDQSLTTVVTDINDKLTRHFSTFDVALHNTTNLLKQSVIIQAVQTNQLAAILKAVENLNTPDYFPTNLIALLDVPNPNTDSAPRWLFSYIFGRQPTNLEAALFGQAYEYGVHNLPFYDYFMRLSFDALEGYDDYWRIWEVGDDLGYMAYYPFDEMSDAFYYEYGTRPLLEAFHDYISTTGTSIDNSVKSINKRFQDFLFIITNSTTLANNVINETTSESGNSFSFSETFINGIESLSDSFTGSVETNISGIATNEIVNVQNDGYNSALANITADNLATPFDSDLTSVVQSLNNQAVSFFPTLDNVNELVLDFGTISFFGFSKEVSFTFSRLPDKYFQSQRFMFAVLEFIVTLMTVYGIYTFITQQTKV